MVDSDWGSWLPEAIADASPDGVSVWYLGCNGFVMKGTGGTTLFVDPYLGSGDPPRTIRMIPVPFNPTDVVEADAVFATHEHTDHVHGPSQGPILADASTALYAPDDSIAVARDVERWHENYALSMDQFNVISEGDAVSVGEFTVHVEAANDPDATHPVSYVFEHDAATVFHGGDTRPSDEFHSLGERYDIDLGILAFGSVGNIPDKQTRKPARTRWYNDENQIIRAANDLQFEYLLPSHWDMWRGMTADPSVLVHHAASFEYPERLELVQIGDRVDFPV